jgi:hypothetical protein
LHAEFASTSSRLEKLIHVLEWIELNKNVPYIKPLKDRLAIVSAFVAKAILNLSTTRTLIERLGVDRMLRRICGIFWYEPLSSESTFSRVFKEFSESNLAEYAACITGERPS